MRTGPCLGAGPTRDGREESCSIMRQIITQALQSEREFSRLCYTYLKAQQVGKRAIIESFGIECYARVMHSVLYFQSVETKERLLQRHFSECTDIIVGSFNSVTLTRVFTRVFSREIRAGRPVIRLGIRPCNCVCYDSQ